MSRQKAIAGVLLAVAALLPLLLTASEQAVYLQHIVVQMMLLGLLAMSWDLIFGYLGMFSFGHAAFFGVAAYTAGIAVTKFGFTSLPAVVALALVAAVIVGFIVGYLSSRVGSVAVFLVTFACAEAIYLIILSDPKGYTNGDNGLVGIMPDPFLGLNLRNETHFYYLALIVLLLSFVALRRLTNGHFGKVLLGIRDNEIRARFAGYRVEAYKSVAFAIAAFFSGISGVLTAFHERIAAPEMAGWLYSAEAVLYATLGGIGTLFGPVLGASIVVLLREVLSDYFTSWLIFVGVAYVVLIVFLPTGIYSLIFPDRQGRSGKFFVPPSWRGGLLTILASKSGSREKEG